MSGPDDRRRALLDLTARPMLSPAEVAALFRGQSVEWFYRNKPTLEAEGFPRPAWGERSGACYDPLAIGLWQVSRMPHLQRDLLDWLLRTPAVPAVQKGCDPLQTLSVELAARAADIATGGGR